tara:strand:+ start:3835 stop:4227 length:393 start_codon:yes stop_codon:yes gene_type:complete
MIEIENLEEHLHQITQEEWRKLFNIISEIIETKDFGNYIDNAKIVSNTLQIIYDLNLPPIFNWSDWSFGREFLMSDNFDYTNLDKITLCKLITCIVRYNRFNEGYTLRCFENRTFEKILINLKKEIEKIE